MLSTYGEGRGCECWCQCIQERKGKREREGDAHTQRHPECLWIDVAMFAPTKALMMNGAEVRPLSPRHLSAVMSATMTDVRSCRPLRRVSGDTGMGFAKALKTYV